MSDEVCPVCGERNAPRTQFCRNCGAYLGWDDLAPDEPMVPEPAPEAAGMARTASPAPQGSGYRAGAPRADTRVLPPEGDRDSGGPPPPPPSSESAPHRSAAGPPAARTPDPETDLRVETSLQEVTVTPGGASETVVVHVANTSTIVEAYEVTALGAPQWLLVEPGEVRLLPGTEQDVPILLRIPAEGRVPTQRLPLRLFVQGRSDPVLRAYLDLDLVVGVVSGPVQLQLEPSTLRARDTTTAMFRVLVDNQRSSEPLRVQLSGRDPEQVGRFAFSHPSLDVPAYGTASSRLRVDAPLPEAGEQLTRTLTVSGTDGRRTFEATATFMQSTSAVVVDPPVELRLEPSTVRAGSGSTGTTTVVADNRRGTRPQRISLTARDDEGAVRFTVTPPELNVPPGQALSARVRLQAPRPDGGEEVTRNITVAAWNGSETVEARGTFVQSVPDRRPLARILTTLIGAALIVLGATQGWANVFVPGLGIGTGLTGTEWNFTAATAVFGPEVGVDPVEVIGTLDDAGVQGVVDAVINAGTVTILLAGVAVFGLTGTKGRLTRAAAVLCVLFVAALVGILFVADTLLVTHTFQFSGGLALVLLGCVVAFIGGLLARR